MSDLRPTRFNILPPVVKNLLIINGLMFLASQVVESTYHFDLASFLGLHYFTSSYFKPFQLITHMFMHGSMAHIFSNMFALWMFGGALENIWGGKRFIIFYIICGIGGALTHLFVTGLQLHSLQEVINNYALHPTIPAFRTLFDKYQNVLGDQNFLDQINTFYQQWQLDPSNHSFALKSVFYAQDIYKYYADIPTVGASGAIFGLLLAFGMLFPNTYLYVYLFLPVKAKYFVLFYALFELYAGFTGSQDGVAHFAHLGGALFGFLMIKIWSKNRKEFY